MSALTRFGAGKIVARDWVPDWQTFCAKLANALFQTAVLSVLRSAGRDPDQAHDILKELERSPAYFTTYWHRISELVAAEYARRCEAQQLEERESRRAKGNRVLGENLAQGLGITSPDAIDLLVGWVSRYSAPASLSDKPLEALLSLDREEVGRYPYAASVESVLLSHLWWVVPEEFDCTHFLRRVHNGRLEMSFQWLWAVFGREIERDHEMRGPAEGEEQPWVERHVARAAAAFAEEWDQRSQATTHLPAHPEYGLLNAVATEKLLESFKGRLQDLQPSCHAPQVLRSLLRAEVKRGATRPGQTRYFSEKARRVVETYNRLLRNDPAARASVGPDLMRCLGTLKSYQVILELEAEA